MWNRTLVDTRSTTGPRVTALTSMPGNRNDDRAVQPLGRQQHVERVGNLDGRRLLTAHVVVSCMVSVGGAAVVPPSAPRQNAQS